MLSRFLLVPLIALSPFSCGNEHAGLSRAAAVKAAKDYVVRVDYRATNHSSTATPATVRQSCGQPGMRADIPRGPFASMTSKRCTGTASQFAATLPA